MYEPAIGRPRATEVLPARRARDTDRPPYGPGPGRWHRFDRFAIEAGPRPAKTAGVLQLKWTKVRHSQDEYYWDGPGQPDYSQLPKGGRAVQAPQFQQMEDVHSSRKGGSMKSLRTVADTGDAHLKNLAHFASQASKKKGLFYEGDVDSRSLGDVPVSSSIPNRVKNEHTNIFKKMTGGESSATKYQQDLGTSEPNTKYNIQHGAGHGEVGKASQSPMNLGSASSGSNTMMIPADKHISGNPDVLVQTKMAMRPGTHRVESTRQQFAYKKYPDVPIYQHDIDGDQPEVTRSQYDQMEEDTQYLKEPDVAAGAVMLQDLGNSKNSGSSNSAPYNYNNYSNNNSNNNSNFSINNNNSNFSHNNVNYSNNNNNNNNNSNSIYGGNNNSKHNYSSSISSSSALYHNNNSKNANSNYGNNNSTYNSSSSSMSYYNNNSNNNNSNNNNSNNNNSNNNNSNNNSVNYSNNNNSIYNNSSSSSMSYYNNSSNNNNSTFATQDNSKNKKQNNNK